MAFARWVITTQGGSASLTVTAPKRTCTTRRIDASVAGVLNLGSLRWLTQATTVTARTTRLTSAAAQR